MSRHNYYHMNIDETLKVLKSGPDGLSNQEAISRLEKYGPNNLKNIKQRSLFWKFIDQFRNSMVGILIVAAVISMVISILNNEPFLDSIAIIAIVILNAFLGFFQEKKADEAVTALSKMQVSIAKTRRDGEIVEVPSADIVPGDIIYLEAGDSVPADARLLWETSLQIDESALTGESFPVEKSINALKDNTPLSDRKNMVYSGTNVSNGRAQAVVCATGMDTEIGLIANSLQIVKEGATPLQQRIDDICKVLSIIIFAIILVIMIVGMVQGRPLMNTAMLAISLAVAAIPEGLSTIITVVLSIGVRDMARKQAIVKTLSSVETLGSTEIICTDKTGTITENKMRIKELYFDGKTVPASTLDVRNILFQAMALANDAERNHQKYIGDPTEIALYECLEDYSDLDSFRDHNPRVGELPFDSERKMMTTINKMQDAGKLVVWSKGSFDSIIAKCNRVYDSGKIQKLTEERIRELKKIEEAKSNKAYRVLAFAYKTLNEKLRITPDLENNLIFIGFAAMIDSPRPDVKQAIKACKTAGIRPVMITGDSKTTATAIAKDVGITSSITGSLTGAELDRMQEEEFRDKVEEFSVYARVSPKNKLTIVNAWQDKGKIVAMTGDGVNDAPALRAADIGVGMGVPGTDVAKAEADLILMDDSFSTIVAAVGEGRKIFDNIKNTLVYLLTGNIAEVIIVFVGMFILPISSGEIFTPVQLLYINLVTDSVPAIMLAYEKESDEVMRRPASRNTKTFFTALLNLRITYSALNETVVVICVLLLTRSLTCTFFVVILSELTFAYTCRNLEIPIWKNKHNNINLNIGILLLAVLQIIVFLTPVRGILGLAEMTPAEILIGVLATFIIFILDELSKIAFCKIKE